MPHPRAAALRSEYLPEFAGVVRIAEFNRPMDTDDVETGQTIRHMDELAAADSNAAEVEAATQEALNDAGIGTGASAIDQAHAVFWWLKRNIRYVPVPGTSPLVDQTLIAPCALLAMPEPMGDCPQFSMLAHAMFRVLCIATRFVTIAAEPEYPETWSHVYNTVEVGPGCFLPFDSSNGPEPGAEYARATRRKVWPPLTPGKCRTKETAPQMVRNAYKGHAGGMRNRVLRGRLGDDSSGLQCDQDGNCYYNGSPINSTTDLANAINATYAPQGECAYGTDANGNCLPAPAPSLLPISNPAAAGNYSSNTSSATANLLSNLISDVASVGTNVVKAITNKPYFVTNPSTGQSVLVNPATGSVATGATLASSVSPQFLLWGGLALLAVVLLGGEKGK